MRRRSTVTLILSLLLVSFLFACATSGQRDAKSGASSTPAAQSTRAGYYEFDYVLVPADMKLDRKDTFTYSTGKFKVGVLTYTGRVEPDSLAAFFQNNMTKDGWRQISTFKFRETTLVFLKDERAALITIADGLFSTKLQIKVGPTEQVVSPAKPGAVK